MLSLWRRGALADLYHAHALNTASSIPRGYRAMWSFTNAVQRDEMAIACTGHAHLVTCERYKRSGEEAFTAKADSERSAKSEIGGPKVRSQWATLTCICQREGTERPIPERSQHSHRRRSRLMARANISTFQEATVRPCICPQTQHESDQREEETYQIQNVN